MITITLILAAFIIGYLLGDLRAVKQFNRMVVEHNDRMERFLMDQALPEPVESEDAEPAQATIH